MSRQNDLADVQVRLAEITKQTQDLNAQAAAKTQEGQKEIQQILKDAGIYDQVEKLEKERGEYIGKLQQTMQELQAEQQKLTGILEYLNKREKVDPSPVKKPKPVLGVVPEVDPAKVAKAETNVESKTAEAPPAVEDEALKDEALKDEEQKPTEK